MFVVDSSKWPPSPAPGQERLLIELWLEALASDTSAPYWPAICSTLQTLRNLLTTLQEVDRQILRAYHVRDSVEESLHKLGDCTWLNAHYYDDLAVLCDVLARLRDIHTDERKGKKGGTRGKKDEKAEDEEEQSGNEVARTRKTDQETARRTATSFLRAFLAKVERENPIDKQVALVRQLTADTTTRFEVLSHVIEELVNDLVHLGHSRDHLHGWMIGAVLKHPNPKPLDLPSVLDRFALARLLGQKLENGCEVLFMVSATAEVSDSEGIRFLDSVPHTFSLPSASPFLTTGKRFAVVTVPNAVDRRAACEQANRHLLRYLHSTRLDHIPFDRAVVNRAAVRIVATGITQEVRSGSGLASYELHNDDEFYTMSSAGRNNDTFAELDRVLYWLEQSRRWDDVGRLIALWTAMEFLFSKTTRSPAESIQEFVPAYLVPNLARELLVDLWAFIEHVKEITLPPDMADRLEVQATGVGKRRKVNLVKLLELCLEPEDINPLKPLIQDYPILRQKFGRVRQLDPKPQQDMPIRRTLSRFESEVVFDLRFAFRARNTIVHDAAIQIVQIDRLIQRLNWMLCTALDALLYQFVRNPTLSLSELHEVNMHNFTAWKKQLHPDKRAVPLSEVVDPPRHCLSSE